MTQPVQTNINTNDRPTLVAPRPVRINSGYNAIVSRSHHSHERVRINDTNSMDDFKLALFSDSPSDKDQLSPRSSPRSGLPIEAVEEFLSILRPSFFPHTSPIVRTHRQGASSLPTFSHERSFSYKGRSLLDIIPQRNDGLDEPDITRSRQPSRATGPCTPDPHSELDSPFDLETDTPVRWFKANILSSPISRNNTRNPFLRHPSNHSPNPLSPAAIPLPLPTSDEMTDI